MTVGLALFWGQPFYFALIPVLVTGIQQRHVHGAEAFFFTAQTRRGWIPVLVTGMREL